MCPDFVAYSKYKPILNKLENVKSGASELAERGRRLSDIVCTCRLMYVAICRSGYSSWVRRAVHKTSASFIAVRGWSTALTNEASMASL